MRPANAPTPASATSDAARSGQRARTGPGAERSPHSWASIGRHEPHTVPAPVDVPMLARVTLPRAISQRTSPKVTLAQWHMMAASP